MYIMLTHSEYEWGHVASKSENTEQQMIQIMDTICLYSWQFDT